MEDFQDFIRRVRQGDMEPIKKLYASMTNKCIGYLRKRGGKADDAKDLLQEAMYIFYKRIKEDDQFTLTAPAEAFVFRVFHIKWLELLRSKGHSDVDLDLDDEGNPAKENLAGEEFLPDNIDLTRSEHPVVKLLDQLGKGCKKILLAYYVHEQSLKAIAEDLEQSYNYIKLKKHRCNQQLRDLYTNL